MNILWRVFTISPTGFSRLPKQNCWTRAWTSAFSHQAHINIRDEFQRVYFELKRLFVTRDLLVLKQKLMSLYGRCICPHFHNLDIIDTEWQLGAADSWILADSRIQTKDECKHPFDASMHFQLVTQLHASSVTSHAITVGTCAAE